MTHISQRHTTRKGKTKQNPKPNTNTKRWRKKSWLTERLHGYLSIGALVMGIGQRFPSLPRIYCLLLWYHKLWFQLFLTQSPCGLGRLIPLQAKAWPVIPFHGITSKLATENPYTSERHWGVPAFPWDCWGIECRLRVLEATFSSKRGTILRMDRGRQSWEAGKDLLPMALFKS